MAKFESGTRVMFATPSYDYRYEVDHVSAMTATAIHLTHLNIDMRVKHVCGCCFIDLARNDLVRHFLATDCTDMFFVDADVGFDYQVVPRFLASKQLIVAGLVPKKWDPNQDPDKPPFHDNAMTGVMQDGLMESYEAPTAFMRIKREVFEILDAAYPYYKEYKTMGRGTPYFQTGYVKDPDSGEVTFMGEDIFFNRQWCKLGERLWIDTDVQFTHRGSLSWRGNYLEHGLKTGRFIKKDDISSAA
jgi:hypothetical protein